MIFKSSAEKNIWQIWTHSFIPGIYPCTANLICNNADILKNLNLGLHLKQSEHSRSQHLARLAFGTAVWPYPGLWLPVGLPQPPVGVQRAPATWERSRPLGRSARLGARFRRAQGRWYAEGRPCSYGNGTADTGPGNAVRLWAYASDGIGNYGMCGQTLTASVCGPHSSFLFVTSDFRACCK